MGVTWLLGQIVAVRSVFGQFRSFLSWEIVVKRRIVILGHGLAVGDLRIGDKFPSLYWWICDLLAGMRVVSP